VFFITAEGGIKCTLCSTHNSHGVRGPSRFFYSRDAAFPSKFVRLKEHLESERHREAISLAVQRKGSIFEQALVSMEDEKRTVVCHRLRLIYWLVKEEIANRKLPSLQAVVDKVSNNKVLQNFGHVSSTSVSEMIYLISHSIQQEIVNDIKSAKFWATLVDETTDISNLQQYITFVRYVRHGEQKTKFVDIRPINEDGATAENLFRYWNAVNNDLDLCPETHVGLACDGAAAMMGKHNSLSQKVINEFPSTTAIHCHAHRLALVCTDAASNVDEIKEFESTLVQLWKFFAVSPKKSQILAQFQKLCHTPGIKLAKACKTRWLSHEKAITAIISEIHAVWKALEYFATSNRDFVANALLKASKTKAFVLTMIMLHHAVKNLKGLSLLFQTDQLNFSHVEIALEECKWVFEEYAKGDDIASSAESTWHLYESEIGPLNETDFELIKRLSSNYFSLLVTSIYERFPESELLNAFKIFDINMYPNEFESRKKHGEKDLLILYKKFKQFVGDWETLSLDFASCKEYMYRIKGTNKTCKSTIELLTKDPLYEAKYPGVVNLAKIAMTLPLSTAWPERGFSTLQRIKSKSRNRLSDNTLNALLNISLNGPSELNEESLTSIAKKWYQERQRRKVHTARAPQEDEDTVDFDVVEFDMDKFLL